MRITKTLRAHRTGPDLGLLQWSLRSNRYCFMIQSSFHLNLSSIILHFVSTNALTYILIIHSLLFYREHSHRQHGRLKEICKYRLTVPRVRHLHFDMCLKFFKFFFPLTFYFSKTNGLIIYAIPLEAYLTVPSIVFLSFNFAEEDTWEHQLSPCPGDEIRQVRARIQADPQDPPIRQG